MDGVLPDRGVQGCLIAALVMAYHQATGWKPPSERRRVAMKRQRVAMTNRVTLRRHSSNCVDWQRWKHFRVLKPATARAGLRNSLTNSQWTHPATTHIRDKPHKAWAPQSKHLCNAREMTHGEQTIKACDCQATVSPNKFSALRKVKVRYWAPRTHSSYNRHGAEDANETFLHHIKVPLTIANVITHKNVGSDGL